MTDRSVVVRLRAEIGDFKKNMAQAAQSAAAVGAAATTGSDRAAKGLAAQRKAAEGSKSTWQGLETASTVAGAAMVAAPVLAIKAMAGFDKQMSAVQAATHASAEAMGRLREAAIDAGSSTVYTAAEAAGAIENLAKAGVSTADILSGGLAGALDLAAAGTMGVEQAAEIAATTLTQFKLSGKDMGHVADLLAAGAGKAQGEVSDLGQALAYTGITAAQMGVGIDETVGTLALLASNGQLADRAGTGLRGVLMSMTAPSKEAAKSMAAYGISMYDAQGKFVGLSGMAQQLHDKLSPLDAATRDAALGQIFGNAQIETARILYEGGAKAVDEWTAKVDDQGYAAETAAMKLDNLAGDFEKLTGAIDSGFIKAGSGGNEALRGLTQGATTFVDALSALPGPALTVGLAVTGIAGAALLAAPRIAATKQALQELNIVSSRTGKMNWGAIGSGLARGGAIAGLTVVGTAALAAHAEIDGLGKSLADLSDTLKSTDSADEFVSALSTINTQLKEAKATYADLTEIDSVGDYLSDFGAHVSTGFQFLTGQVTDIDKLEESMKAAGEEAGRLKSAQYLLSQEWGTGQSMAKGNNAELARAAELLGKAAAAGVDMSGSAGEVKARVMEWAEAFAIGQSGANQTADAVAALGDSTMSAAEKAKSLGDAISATFGVLLNSSNAAIAAEAAIDELGESLAKNGNNWNLDTAAGRENQAGYNKIIDSATRAAQTKLEETGSIEEATAAYHDYLARAAEAPGRTEKQRAKILELNEAYQDLPIEVTTDVSADTRDGRQSVTEMESRLADLRQLKTSPKVTAEIAQLEAKVAEAKAEIASVQGKTVTITARFQASHPAAGVAHATGGWVSGPGTATSDSIPARLSDGEYVVNARQARKHGPLLEAINSGAQGFAKGGKAGGGSLDEQIAAQNAKVKAAEKRKRDAEMAKLTKAERARQKKADRLSNAVSSAEKELDRLEDLREKRDSDAEDLREKQAAEAQKLAEYQQAESDRLAEFNKAEAQRKADHDESERQRLADYNSTKARAYESSRQQIANQFTSGSLSYDPNAYAQAQKNTTDALKAQADAAKAAKDAMLGVADAEMGVFEARRKLANAKLADRPEALKELAAAQKQVTDAKLAAADAEKQAADAKKASAAAAVAEAAAKPTAANILKSYTAYRQKVQQYATDLAALKAKGLGGAMISDIVKRGFDEGSGLARIMASTFSNADIAKANSEWGQIERAGLQIGTHVADQEMAGYEPFKAGPAYEAGVYTAAPRPKALGGPVSAGRTYLVGEEGPETFVPGVSGAILPAAHMTPVPAASAANSSNVTYTAPLRLEIDARQAWEGFVEFHRSTGFQLRGGQVFR